jgi:hypothetical protein
MKNYDLSRPVYMTASKVDPAFKNPSGMFETFTNSSALVLSTKLPEAPCRQAQPII